MFNKMIHADWSMNPRKRWAAAAELRNDRWVVETPALVGPSAAFLDDVFADGAHQTLLLGFDFPIGMPAAYGALSGFSSFQAALPHFGEEAWGRFFDVAQMPSDISITRPFYPLSSTKGVSRSELVAGLGVSSFDDLLRICERRTEHRQSACSLFWTLGGNQVGKGALSGWKEVIRPAVIRGATLWPFDGRLEDLACSRGVVMAETYPAEAYRMVGAGFRPSQSKRRQADRQDKAEAIMTWAARHGVTLTEAAVSALKSGFGSSANGEDQFDALLGLLKMIEINEGRRAEMTEWHQEVASWEGWILGR